MNPHKHQSTEHQNPSENQIEAILKEIRPNPRERFRSALNQRLVRDDPGHGSRPKQLWLHALVLIAIGAVVLVIGALISVGSL